MGVADVKNECASGGGAGAEEPPSHVITKNNTEPTSARKKQPRAMTFPQTKIVFCKARALQAWLPHLLPVSQYPQSPKDVQSRQQPLQG